MAIITLSELKAHLKITDSSQDTYLTALITRVEAQIKGFTGRIFGTPGTASERKYDGNGTPFLFIDDCTEITELKIDDTVVATDKYFKRPLNAAARALPFTWIEMDEDLFESGFDNIAITAKWGYGVAPADVQIAALNMCAYYNSSGNRESGGIRSKSAGDISISYSEGDSNVDTKTGIPVSCMEILKRFKRSNPYALRYELA